MNTRKYRVRNLDGEFEDLHVRPFHNNGESRMGYECGPAVAFYQAETFKTTKGRLIARFWVSGGDKVKSDWYEVKDFTRESLADLWNAHLSGALLNLWD